MEETFLININCSKILADSEETQYTMCIDSTKMSIVYELAEWIRWIFSLDDCFYITHNNSVIHELEDIQLLSRLGSLEIKPCGRSHCVHKKMYRTLLKKLDLFAPWNGMEVHKYFLHKLYQVDQKLTQENSKINPTLCASKNKDHQDLMVVKSTRTDNTKDISPDNSKLFLRGNKLPKPLKDNTDINKTVTGIAKSETNAESLNKPNSSPDKKILNENVLISSEYKLDYLNDSHSEGTENLTVETDTLSNHTPVNTIKNKLPTVQEQNKNPQKSYSKKYVKPFSLGEILSNIREDFEKQNTEMFKKMSPSPNSLVMKEGNFDEEVTSGKNSFITENKMNKGRKRQRTRKRKRSKKGNLEKEEITSPYLDANVGAYSFGLLTPTHAKPNHIRFDTEDEEMEIVSVQDEWNKQNGNKFEITSKETNNLTDIEYIADEQNAQIKNEFEITSKPINNSSFSTFLKTNHNEYTTLKMDSNQDLSELHQTSPLINSTENNMEFSSAISSQISAEEKLIDLDVSESANQPSYVENSKLKSSKSYLSTLLSLKEKCKNAVVIERFY